MQLPHARQGLRSGPAPPKYGSETEALEVERRLREVLVAETRPRLDDPDPVALLGKPQRGHRAAEARADDKYVEVVRLVSHAVAHFLPSLVNRRTLVVMNLA